jgi:hypothetical protein
LDGAGGRTEITASGSTIVTVGGPSALQMLGAMGADLTNPPGGEDDDSMSSLMTEYTGGKSVSPWVSDLVKSWIAIVPRMNVVVENAEAHRTALAQALGIIPQGPDYFSAIGGARNVTLADLKRAYMEASRDARRMVEGGGPLNWVAWERHRSLLDKREPNGADRTYGRRMLAPVPPLSDGRLQAVNQSWWGARPEPSDGYGAFTLTAPVPAQLGRSGMKPRRVLTQNFEALGRRAGPGPTLPFWRK